MFTILTSCNLDQNIKLRYRKQKGDHEFFYNLKWKPKKTAIIVVDMWDKHHCQPSQKRIVLLAKKINRFLFSMRKLGVQVVFAPSGVTSFYRDFKARKKIKKIISNLKNPSKKLPKSHEAPPPPIPVKSGCENSNNKQGAPWSRQNAILEIMQNDVISDNDYEIVNFLTAQKIETVLYAGVHSNICIPYRSFGMKNLREYGFSVVLIRDLTDSYTTPTDNYPSQKLRNEAVIKYIETYIGFTVDSLQFL